MYSTHYEGKPVVAERFIRTLKHKIYKYMTSISKTVYIDKLDDIVNKYNNIYHSTIKINPTDLNSSLYIDFGIRNNEKVFKFKISDHVRLLNYKNIFGKGYTPNWSEECFGIKKVKNTVHGNMLLVILMVKEWLEHFTKNNCEKQIKRVYS